jgi:hypothetical protein
MNRISSRLAAASGAAYVALVVVGNDVLGGSQKGLDVTDSRAAHATALAKLGAPTFGDWASLFLEGAGLLAFLVFVATLWNVLRRADDESPFPAIAWAAGLASGIVKIASIAPALAVYWRVRDGWSPQLATALLDVNGFAFVSTWALDGLMLCAVAVVALRTRALSRPVAIAAAVLGPLGILATIVANGPGFLPFVLTLLWFVCASIGLVRQAGEPRRPARQASAAAVTA